MPRTDSRSDYSASGNADLAFSHWFESHRIVILSLSVLAGLVFTLLFFSFTADDAFISFRYAKNLVLHHVWNWNDTGPREDACTSALYAVLAILPVFLHLPTVVFMKLVGFACFGVLIYRLHTKASSPFASILGMAILCLSPVVWIHVYSGLETPLYMLLIVEMGIAIQDAPQASPLRIYTLFLLLPLTRPEGLVFACAGVLLFWKARGQASKRLPLFAAAVTLGLAYFAARAVYFHHLLPNPFYVKVAHQPLRNLVGEFAVNLAKFKGYVFALVLVAVLSRNAVTRTFALCSMLLLTLLFAPHEMAMNYADRFYIQLTLPILLLFLIVEDVSRIARLAITTAALFLFAFSPDDLLLQLKYPADIARAHFDLGHRLAPFRANHTLIAGDVGGIPFYSDWFSYDFLGLATNSIAQHGVTVASLNAMHPDLIILYNKQSGPGLLHDDSWVGGPDRTGKALVQYINQSGQFDYAGSAKSNGFYLVEFLRRDTPQHDAILTALQANAKNSLTEPTLRNILRQRYLPSSH